MWVPRNTATEEHSLGPGLGHDVAGAAAGGRVPLLAAHPGPQHRPRHGQTPAEDVGRVRGHVS